jgi:hypothetical protein
MNPSMDFPQAVCHTLDPMPVIIGAPRSGTTLLRFMVDGHPSIAIPPETGFLAAPALFDCDLGTAIEFYRILTTFPPDAPAWQDFGLAAGDFWNELQHLKPFDQSEGFRVFYRLYAKKQNKPRYGDKTAIYSEHVARIKSILPEAHFVHIIRDGRDASLSLRRMWFAPGQDIRTLALYWQQMVRKARDAGRRSGAYLEISYEDLVRNPQPVLETVCRFIEIQFDAAMLRYWERTPERLKEHRTRHRTDGTLLVSHEQRLMQQSLTMRPPQPDRIFRWKEEMTAHERSEFLRIAGDKLDELGYEV